MALPLWRQRVSEIFYCFIASISNMCVVYERSSSTAST
jgi:hypothetical protein